MMMKAVSSLRQLRMVSTFAVENTIHVIVEQSDDGLVPYDLTEDYGDVTSSKVAMYPATIDVIV